MKNAIEKSFPPASDLGNINAQWYDSETAGGCNFCTTKNYQRVLVIQGRGTSVRFCRKCFDQIKHK